jgi:succinate-semialdehyde dehydrogenase/glutarate-semialdehyde dehydrogenase
LVEETVLERFLQILLSKVQQLKVAAGTEPDSAIGPLIEAKAVAKVQQLLDDALDQGATLLHGGKPHPAGPLFFEPTLLTGVTPQMQLFQQEIFGPVLAITSFNTEQQAIALANASDYGLAGYIYSQQLGQVFRLAQALQVGMLGVNEGIISNAAAPFGGIKQSGFGREGSRYGLDDYTQLRYVYLGGLS